MRRRIKPGPGQESVWDYPRPPKLEPVPETVKVVFGGVVIAESDRVYRVLETSHPPVYHIAQTDIEMDYLKPNPHRTYCEFKGQAVYWDLEVGDNRSPLAAWSYPQPNPAFAAIKDHLAFYASRVDEAYVGEEKVMAQEGDFYGGWITSKIVGPFKGGPGTWGW
jgi:uncharacterized protein (DUF427 family)